MDRSTIQAWLDRYIAAWRSNDRTAIEALFAADAVYRWHPWEDGVTGRSAIADAWLADPDEPDSWRAEYRPLAVDPDGTVVTLGHSEYLTDDRSAVDRIYDNVFICRFDGDGRCTDFTEFYVKRASDAA